MPGTAALPTDSARLRSTCGHAILDNNLQLEIGTLNALFELTNALPSFSFYDDFDGPIGAKALRRDNNSADIFLGLFLVEEEMSRDRSAGKERGITSIIGTLAHEWAHALQYESNFDERRFLWETHADYMSGWYLGAKVATGITGLDINEFSHSLYLKGGRVFSEDGYGLPEHRVRAMKAGYNFALFQTSRIGRTYVFTAAGEGYVFVSSMLKSME